MYGKYTVLLFLHAIVVGFVFKVIGLILPNFILCYYSCAANFLLFLVIARCTFCFTKKRYLGRKVSPENRAVIITGCDSGFGNMLARRLDSRGFHVFASCLFPSEPGALDLKKSCSKRLQLLELDVRSDDSVRAALKFVTDNLGTSELWAVVNNAGIQKGFTLELTPIEDFIDTVEVNTFGIVRVTKAFLPLLRQSRGRVVNLTSISGILPTPHMTPYIASKFAAQGITDALRQELDIWGVRVVCVQPELFETPLTKSERIAASIDSTFEKLDDETKADYGEKYLKNFKTLSEFLVGVSSPKVDKVINALEAGVSVEYPYPVYRPTRHVFAHVLISLFEILPVTIRDLMIKVVLFCVGFPTPKEASNSS